MTTPVESTDDFNDFLSYLETPSPRCSSANNSVVASPTTMSPNNATDITEIVARRYTKVSFVLSLSLSH